MPISAFTALVFGASALAVGLYHFMFVAPRLRSIGMLFARASGTANVGESLATRAAQTAVEQFGERLADLERTYRRDVHRIGFIRYNSFDDVGSDLSFTLALLNDDGDGIVLTNIFSREETRTYGKAVRKFVPQQGASKEEQSAIAMARTGVGV